MKQWLRKLSFAAGRALYADESSLHHHLKCHAVLAYRRALSRHRRRDDGPFDPQALRERGYVRLVDLYEPSLVETIRRTMTARMDDPDSIATRQRPGPDGKQYSWYLKDPARVLPEIAELLLPALLASLENHYRAHVDVLKVKCWRNIHVPPAVYAQREVYSNYYHCDHSRAPGLLKMFYLVNDVTADDGPFRVQPRPRTRELMRRGWGNRNDYRVPEDVVEDPRHVLAFTGPAGAVMIADTTCCLHRASSPEPGHLRDIIQFQLVPSTRALDPAWLSVPRKTRLSQQELGQAPGGYG